MATMGRAAAQAAAAFMARAAAQIPIFRILKVITVVLTSNLARVISISSRGLPDPSKAAQQWTVSCVYYQFVQARPEAS